MKKTMLFSSALVALAMLTSCQKEEFIETPATATGVTEFTATIEQPTKTVIYGDGKVTWEKGDTITVTTASKSAVYVAASSGAITTFTLKEGETAVGSGPYTATYGDINKQKYKANAAGANCPLSAETKDASSKTLHFSSPYAVLKITAKSSNSNSDVIKTVVVTYGDNGSFLDCGNGVTLTSDGVVFYVAVQPATEAAAPSVTFYNTDGKVATKTRTKPISLAANDLLPVKFESLNFGPDTPTFKAVYNTAGDANTLTFYYDTKTYSGEGITFFDNLPVAATTHTDWEYNSIRASIKSVKIDPSVAGYKDLTSTASMFQSMINAIDISGAEYLDVSNVTNMSNMFINFGKNSITKVPIVSGWETGQVRNMSNMFQNYGYSSATLNEVPDVSRWETGQVEDMGYMFQNYGNTSNDLNKVPDVSGWKTGKVMNMKYMFNNYGGNSTALKKVPDVSRWDTGKVEDMGYMFQNYGKTSNILAEVPEVSDWNTEKVQLWSSIFNGYGTNSEALTTVPNVSKWKTNAVNKIEAMFQNFGSKSQNIVCSLDLSKWDLSNISEGANAFDFKPNTFNVTIPAKTGTTDNDSSHWFYDNGNSHISPAGETGNHSFTCAPATP